MAGNPVMSVGSALYTVLSAGTVGAFNSLAPQGSTPPYVVFQLQAGTEEYTFTSNGSRMDWVVKVLINRLWPGEAADVYSATHDLVQDAALTVTGYTAQRCRRIGELQYRDPDGFWHVGGTYRIDIHSS